MKETIIKCINHYTEEFCTSGKLSGSTQAIAEENFVSRSLVSQYLNEMFKEGMLLKINTRPVYFLNKRIIEKTFKVAIKSMGFDCVEDFPVSVFQLHPDVTVIIDEAAAELIRDKI